MAMNLKQFKYVLALAREGSFSAAADALSIRQPSLSQYIKKIEQEVGMELFDRTAGSVRLTDAGRAYIEIGRKMLDLEHQLEEQFSDIAAFRSGTVTVGISAHRSVALMPGIAKAFRERYPGILLRIVEKKRGDILEAASHGEFDLCITTLPVDEKQFNSETVMLEENVLAVPRGISFPAQKAEGRKFPAIPVAALNGMDFAMLNDEHPMQRELEQLCDEYALSLRKTVECTSLEALLEMAKAGIGAAYIPSCIARPDPGVTYCSIMEETGKREIVLAERRDQYQSQAVQDLKTIIRSTLEKF